MTKRKKIILGVLAIVIGLPVALIAAVMAWFWMEGKTNGAVVTSRQTRKYLLYVPKSYDRSKPTPLVISLHPAATRPETEMEITGWNDVADEHGFIVVYPSGSEFPRVWPMEDGQADDKSAAGGTDNLRMKAVELSRE
jgi:poly(3-hydroxybutyrate) depolymerase